MSPCNPEEPPSGAKLDPMNPPPSGNPRKNLKVNMQKVVDLFALPEPIAFEKTTELPCYDDRNYRIFSATSSKSWVVKGQHLEHVSRDHVQLQVEAMCALNENDIPAPVPVPLRRKQAANENENENVVEYVAAIVEDKALLHVIGFVDGAVLFEPDDAEKSDAFCLYLGKLVADVHYGWRRFLLPGEGRDVAKEVEKAAWRRKVGTFTWEWSTSQIPAVVNKKLGFVEDDAKKKTVDELRQRVAQVISVAGGAHAGEQEKNVFLQNIEGDETTWNPLQRFLLEKQFIHTDLNDSNILFKTLDFGKDQYSCGAVLDFGDSGVDYVLFDIGIAAAYASMFQKDVARVVACICEGYRSQTEKRLQELAAKMKAEVVKKEDRCTEDRYGRLVREMVAASTSTSAAEDEGQLCHFAKWPRQCLEVVVAAALGRKLLSYVCACEQAVLQPENKEYVEHTAAPICAAAFEHKQWKNLGEAVDKIEAIMNELQ
eukprot:g13160.t1